VKKLKKHQNYLCSPFVLLHMTIILEAKGYKQEGQEMPERKKMGKKSHAPSLPVGLQKYFKLYVSNGTKY